jgi:hypothetical protein
VWPQQANNQGGLAMAHKFYLGQAVEYRPPRGIYAPRGAYVVTAKLPERDGEFEYHIRSVNEQHERVVWERELSALRPPDKKGEPSQNP